MASTPVEVTRRLADLSEGENVRLGISDQLNRPIEAELLKTNPTGDMADSVPGVVDTVLSISDEEYRRLCERYLEDPDEADGPRELHVLRFENPSDAPDSIPDEGETELHLPDAFPEADRGYPVAKFIASETESGETEKRVTVGELRTIDEA